MNSPLTARADVAGRERLKEVHEVAGGEPVVQREVSAEHLQPHEGDKRPLQIHEGGIPDGYYPIDLNTRIFPSPLK